MFLATLLLSLLAPGWTGPLVHPGPPVVLEVRISEEEVSWTLRGEQVTLHPWLGLDGPLDLDRPENRERIGTAMLEALSDRYRFSLDGERVVPELVAVETPDASWFDGVTSTAIRMRLSVEALPRSVGVLWPATFQVSEWKGQGLPVRFICFGRHEFHQLSEAEPECAWHVGRLELRRATELSPIEVDEDAAARSDLPLTWLWISAPLWIAGSIVLLRSRRRARWLILPALLGITAGLFAWSMDRASADPLAAMTRRERFETLHRRLYRAFSSSEPGVAYDRLAASLHPSILDAEYQRLYESLVLRDEGGVVCEVERVEVLDGEVASDRPPPDEPPSDAAEGYWVDWHWRVYGQVAHWGHEHHRTLEYRASYWVCRTDMGWRIAKTIILEQKRLG
ncbi:MAG: hypothetical protein RL885_20750 [Planctomycetota bacterium]